MPAKITNYTSMLSQTYRQLQSLLVLFTLLFSFGKLSAQACDENIRKALEQTRVTTFSKVTQGATGEFIIRYPLAGTKYTLKDQAGNVYTYTYTGSPVEITIRIPVGAVTTARNFSFTAENGGCSYSTDYKYSITPQTTTDISVRVEDEWCNDGGGIYFQMIGANTTDYDFYMKKSSEANYDFSPTKRLAYSGAQTLKAGSYDLIAVLKTDNTKKVERKGIKVEMLVEPIVFTAQYIPSVCAGQQASVKVNVTSGKYPLYFTLYDKTFNTVIKPKQTSNVFTNVPKGEYRVLVENFCAVGGGAQRPQPVVVEDYFFSLQKIESAFVFEHACNYATFKEISFTSDNIQYIWERDAFPYPFTIKFNFTSPNSQVYTVSKTISNRTDLERAFYISNGSNNNTLYWREDIYQNIPLAYGDWKIEAQLIACGNTKTLPIVTKKLLDPIEYIETPLSTESTCNPNRIQVGMKNIGENRDYPVYMVLEEYPNTFNPDAAGFYKINTTNSKLTNKYVKKYDSLRNHYYMISTSDLRPGDVFQFRAVSVDCNKDRLLDKVTIPSSAITTSYTYFWQTASCKSTPTGSKFANLIIANAQYTNNITEVKLVAFNGDSSKLPVSLPYTLTNRNSSAIQQEWQVDDMPVGKYTYIYSDICGNTYTTTGELIEDQYTITWEEGCVPKVKGTLQATPKYRTEYLVERFDEATAQWKTAASNGNPLPILGNHGNSEAVVTTRTQGKFRVIRKIVNPNGSVKCIQVVSEKEYKGDLRQPKIITFRCSVGGKHHIALAPQGGTPPYTYELVSEQKTGQTNPTVLNKAGDDENFFLNIDGSDINTRYVFKVTDACNRAETVDWIVSNYQPLQIEADKTTYCDGQRAVLSVPYLGSKITIKWYRADAPNTALHTGATYTITNLVSADFSNKYIVKLETTHTADVNTCLIANTSEYQFVRPANAPTPTAVQKHDTVKCLSNDPVDNATYPAMFDLNELFTDNNSNPLYIKKITDKSGVIAVPANGQVNLNTSAFVGKTNTFVYTISSSCGEVLTTAEATLKVMKPLSLQGVKTDLNLCQTSATYQDIENLMYRAFGSGYNQLRNSGATFEWYESQTDAEAQNNKKTATTSIGTIADGSSKNLYLRLVKEGYCASSVYTIKVNKVVTAAPESKTLGSICALTVGELKKLIDPANPSQIVVYQGGRALDNLHHLLSTTGITYTKKMGDCETAQAAVSFTFKGAQTQGQAQTLRLCTLVNDANGFSYVLASEVRDALKALYPNATVIKMYSTTGSEYTDADFVYISNRHTFTIEENNKCASDPYTFSILEKEKTAATPKTVSLCAGVAQTVANIKTQLADSSAKVYLKNGNNYNEQADNATINTAVTYYYTVQATGKCVSDKAPISFSIGQTTDKPEGPNSTTSCVNTVAELKADIRTQEPTRNGQTLAIYAGLLDTNKGTALADSATLTQTTYSYAYTEAGKCESAIRHITISRVATPTVAQTAYTLCGGGSQTIASLQPQGANIVWYNSATGGSPLASTTPLVAGTTYYVAQKSGNCESERVAVVVTQGTSGNETLNFQSSNNSLNCIPTGQLRFQIQNAQAGNTYVVELIEAPATYTGTRTFSITANDKDGAITFVKFTGYNMPAGNYKAKLHACSVANSQPVPATIGKLQRDFPAPIRTNNDFGSDQVYRDIQSGGQPSCEYLDIRYSNNTNSPFYKYFNTPELAALYEYTAYSKKDLAEFYGGDENNANIVWRPLFSVPAGKTSSSKMIYYDLKAHNRTYKDLKEDPDKLPKFYFRIKGQNCNNNDKPMEAGDMRFMNTGIVFGGTCATPKMSITAENQIVCYPVNYIIKQNGVKVGEGQITAHGERKEVTTLSNGQPFKANEEYEVVFTSTDGQTATRKETFNTFYNRIRPGGQYKQEVRCFGDTRTPKGRIEVLFRVNQSGSILPMQGFKVTLLQAPAGYVNEPGKLKLNETVTINYRNPNSVTTNIMATQNQDDVTQNFSLPEGIYKIKVEDLCGNVTYVYSGLNSTKEEFELVYPSYQEKPLTPQTETECAKVRVYPFRGNPTFDWLKAENKNRSVYVYLYKRPDGIAEGDVTVSSNLSQQLGVKRYIKAVYNPNEPNSVNQYFSLPRNQNSEGSYTFVYGGKIDATNSNEQDIFTYISSNGTNGCVRTFTISVDDVLLNFDRNGYIGYKCEDNTGKIVVKAINGIGGSGTYQYDLYNVKNGTLIESKTAAKGTAVTFTNLGTFTAGQNSRWVKITDSACASDPVWKELPITPLNNPQLALATPLQTAYCKGETVTITLHSLGATAYQWKYPNGTTVTTTAPQLVIPSIDAQHAGTYQVVAQGLTCAANTVTFNYDVRILEKPATGNTYTFCAAATVAELKAKVATDTATVNVYKNGTLVTNNNEALSATAAYTVSRFNATCETDKVAVAVTISNTVSLTVPATLTVTCTAANIDTTVNNWLGQATVTDTCGTATLTHDFAAVKPTNWCNTSVVTVTFVGKDPQGNTITKTSVIKVNSTPIVAKADIYTITNGTSTTTTTGTVLDNDKLGTKTPTTTDVILTVVTTTTDVVGATKTPTLNNDGTVTVPSGTKSGTYEIVYSICERLNPDNCATATATVKVGSTPIVAKADTYTITNGTSTTTTTGTVLDNDKLGTKTPTTTDVILTVVTTTTDVVGATKTPTLNNDGTVTVPSGTKSGTYEIVYSICERLNPDNCATATATVKVGSTPIIAKADIYTVTNGTSTTTTTGTVLDNDKLDTKTPTTTDVILTVVTTTTDVVGATKTPTLNSDGTITVPSGTKSGTYEIVYSICERLNPDNCATATATVKVGSTPIVAKVDTYTITNGTSTTTTTGTVLDNDKLGTKTPTTTDVILTVVTTTTDVVGATKTPSIDLTNGKVTVPSGTKSGTYEIVYSICERLNPDNCATATATVKVGSTPIVAKVDTYTVTNGTSTTTTTGTVLDNDKLGTKTPTTTDVILTVVTTTTDVVGATKTPTLNNNGTITVPSGTKSGTYEIVYSICERLNPNNCATATATVKVGSTPIVAKADTYTITNGTSTTTTTGTVLDNDKLGTKTPTTTDVILTIVTTTTDVVGATKTPTLNNDGTITVPSGTKSGTYEIVYSICERLNPNNCATATATVKVGSTPIVAKADTYTVTNGTNTTTTTGTVLDNDKLGTKTPTTTDVILTVVTTTTDVVGATKTPTLNSDGTITVPSGTKSGTYEIVYSICERLNPDNCATATATVKVLVPTVATPTTIEAVNDGVTTITSTTGGTTPSVLTNDKLNGVPNPSISSVTLTWNTATPTGFTLNPNGTIRVAPNTPVGTHTISYTICAVASPTVCSTASIVVTVSGTTTSTTPVLPIAVDDRSATAINTPVVVNVLGNDTPNGATTPNVVTNPANGTVVVNVDGSIEYRPNTGFEGTDTFVYEICNTDGCASATVTIDVVNKLVPYNGMSVDGDGKNDYFHIGGIERYPNNVVRIYNRWGVKVFETEGYDNVTRVFRGISNGRVTVDQAEKLPQGTYYYVIEYYDSNNNKESLVGWLYLKK